MAKSARFARNDNIGILQRSRLDPFFSYPGNSVNANGMANRLFCG